MDFKNDVEAVDALRKSYENLNNEIQKIIIAKDVLKRKGNIEIM